MEEKRALTSLCDLLRKLRRRVLFSWGEVVVFGFVVLSLADGLKVFVHPRIPWMVFGVAATLGTAAGLRLMLRNFLVWLPAAGALVLSVVVVSTRSGQPIYDLAQGAKLAVVVGVGASLLVSQPRYSRVAFGALVAALSLNCVLLLCGLLGATSVAWEMAPGRWGTMLNPPGTLGRLGVAAWLYSGYVAVIARRWWGWGLLIMCWGLVFMDASRAQFMLAAGIGVLLVGLAWVESGGGRVRRVALAAVVLTATTISFLIGERPEIAAAMRSGTPDLSSLTFDLGRGEALLAGLQAIRAHPFLGTGIGTTRVQTLTGPVVVHNAFLQVWADIGILGFMAYTWLMLSWLFWSARAWVGVRLRASASDRALGYSSWAMLVAAAVGSLFVPLSTEWAEWILFLFPLGLFWEAVRFGTMQRMAHGHT